MQAWLNPGEHGGDGSQIREAEGSGQGQSALGHRGHHKDMASVLGKTDQRKVRGKKRQVLTCTLTGTQSGLGGWERIHLFSVLTGTFAPSSQDLPVSILRTQTLLSQGRSLLQEEGERRGCFEVSGQSWIPSPHQLHRP